MTHKRIAVAALLGAAALAVGLQNYVFFAKLAGDARPAAQAVDDALDDDGAEPVASAEPLAALDPLALAAWLAAQPGPGRSPFLTRAEAELLGETLSPSLPRLEGTLFGASRRVAWLDGRPHSEGDVIHDHRIERIHEGRVVLSDGDSRIELALYRPRPSGPAEREAPIDAP